MNSFWQRFKNTFSTKQISIPRIEYLFEGKYVFDNPNDNHSHCPYCHADMDFLGCTDQGCRSKHSDVRFGM